MKHRLSRTVSFLAGALVLTVLLGSLHGAGAFGRAQIEEDLDESLRIFGQLLNLMEVNNATPVDPETAVYGAIDGMLRSLDPHSAFIRPEDAAERRQDL